MAACSASGKPRRYERMGEQSRRRAVRRIAQMDERTRTLLELYVLKLQRIAAHSDGDLQGYDINRTAPGNHAEAVWTLARAEQVLLSRPQRNDRRLTPTRRPGIRRLRRSSTSSRGDPDEPGDEPPSHSRCCGLGCSRCVRRWAS